jgi:hypothetical protein
LAHISLFFNVQPRWLFLVPGGVFIVFGLLGYLVAMSGLRIGHSTFDAHTLLFASLAILCGYQWILFALFAKTFAVTEGFLPPDRHLQRFFEVVNLEKGLVIAAVAILAGSGLLLAAVWQWWLTGFGHLDYARTMPLVVPGATLVALGFQTVFSPKMRRIDSAFGGAGSPLHAAFRVRSRRAQSDARYQRIYCCNAEVAMRKA